MKVIFYIIIARCGYMPSGKLLQVTRADRVIFRNYIKITVNKIT